MATAKTVMLSAGEASGDMHGAELIHKLRQTSPNWYFKGMGSRRLREAGCELLIDSADIGVVGIVEVLAHWKQIQNALKRLQNEIILHPPDLLILIDYPEFNLKLARFAKARGIKVLFYVSPQIWAWRPKRIDKIGAAIDYMAVVFPFEVALYETKGIPVRYVGHPLLEKTKPALSRQAALAHFNLQANKKILGIFPGSRKSEIQRLLPLLLTVAARIHQNNPDIQFVLPIASTLSRNFIESYTANSNVPILLTEDHYYDLIQCCDSIITASGTATLEIGLIGTPMLIVYRVAWLTYAIMKRMIQVAHIGLVNIVAEQRIAPEFIQNAARSDAIYAEAVRQLHDEHYNQGMRETLKTVRYKLSDTGAKSSLAQWVQELFQTPAH